MRGICEGVEHHLWSRDSCPAYRGICALCFSKPIPWCTAVRAESGRLLTEESKMKARCTDYFERLYQADSPAVKLDVSGVTISVTTTWLFPQDLGYSLFTLASWFSIGFLGI